MKSVDIKPNVEEEQIVEEAEETPLSFSKDWKKEFVGVLQIGSLQKTIELFGHEFVIRTLNEDELLKVFSHAGKYQSTMANNCALRMITVAAALEYVDGQPFYIAIDKECDIVYEKWQKIKSWYSYTVDALYNEYADLDREANEIAQGLKK